MEWIIIPQVVVAKLSNDSRARFALAEILEETPGPAFLLNIERERHLIGSIVQCTDKACLLTVWWSRGDDPISVVDSPLLSIWCDSNRSNISALDESDRADVLKRVCQLAIRIWRTQPFPQDWHPSRIGDFDSIYAGGYSRLRNLRVAYIARTLGKHKVVEVGSLYYAWRQTKTPLVPLFPPDILQTLPSTVPVPNASALPAIDVPQDTSEGDRDVIIGKPSEETHHLFSFTYGEWVRPDGPLTRQQRRVINHPVQKPLRIHGPAGSGKTLVLILKALQLLRQAQDRSDRCHILFVVTSAAVQATIRAAIEAIDDRMFLATSRTDLQFLDVETLHGWCIRELNLDQTPERVLERDPKASKEIQERILMNVFQHVYDERFERVKDWLSKDFLSRIGGKRDHLLRDLRWEIAIRIKGRGFRRSDRDLYVKSSARSFVGTRDNEWDRHFIFHVYEEYEKHFHEERLLDTDDIVLSMAARLSTSLWDRQRVDLGYDYVMVDETHLFNENERRVLPLLTRGTAEYPPLAMTFDEAQSIGGHRGLDLASVGITNSERKTLTVVHRCSPDIFALARDLVERSPLIFTEFANSESVPRMSKWQIQACQRPQVLYVDAEGNIPPKVQQLCENLRSGRYKRVGVIAFDPQLLSSVLLHLQAKAPTSVYEVQERGERLAAVPRPGIYVMGPEACGGLEFDAVILIGVDDGRVPVPMGDLSGEGYLSLKEEAFIELYTAITRARYVIIFICERKRGISEVLAPSLRAGLLDESP